MYQKRCGRVADLGRSRLEVLFIRSICAGHVGRIAWQEAPALVRKPDLVRVRGLSLLW